MNEFCEGEYIIYRNGEKYELGKIASLREDGAFVCYHEGETAAIDALGKRPMVWIGSAYEIAQRNQYDMDKLAIETVPSAQPESHDKRTETHACDTISRQAAIDGVKILHDVAWKNWHEPTLSANVVIDMIKDLPPAQPEQRWIPVSERFPEDWVPVLVTLKRPERLPSWIKATPENYYHIVDADVCENGKWSVNGKNVLAWMPLPEPYREEGEQE